MSEWDERLIVDLRRGDAAAIVQSLGHANNIPDATQNGRKAIEFALRSEGLIQTWVNERLLHERRNAPEDSNSVMGGMAMGSIETLEALKAWLNGDEEA